MSQNNNRQSMSIADRIQQLGLNNNTTENGPSKLPLPPPRFVGRRSGPQDNEHNTKQTNVIVPNTNTNGEQKKDDAPQIPKKNLPTASRGTGPPPLPPTTNRPPSSVLTSHRPPSSARITSTNGDISHITMLQQQLVHTPEVLTPYNPTTPTTPVENVDQTLSAPTTPVDYDNTQHKAQQPLADIINANNPGSRKTLPPPPSRFSTKPGSTPRPVPPIPRTKSQLPSGDALNGDGVQKAPEPVKKGVFVEYKPPVSTDDSKKIVAKVISEEEIKQKEEFNERYQSPSQRQNQAAITIQKNYRAFKARKLFKKKSMLFLMFF
jgi:hypothetical protein